MAWGIGGVPRPGSRPAARPLLYLDVDGVLNPLAPSDPARFVRQAWPYRGILLVPVDPDDGLTRRHVNRLLSWPRAASATR